jgi:two-component system, chemotaxis family, chemotaxis protein CheY
MPRPSGDALAAADRLPAATVSSGRDTACRPDMNRVRILVVDSDVDTRLLYREVFTLAGHEVVEALDGREGMVKALMHPPQLVITETQLPIMDGYALCEILRRDRATHRTPIVVVTAESRADRLQRARAVGADVVLVKPADLGRLLAETGRLLDAGAHCATPLSPDGLDGDGAGNGSDGRRRTIRSRTHARFDTVTPPARPPDLHCPACDSALAYQYSHVGGVSSRHPEQWDYYVCSGACGAFEYRQRTRRVRRVETDLPRLR